MTSRVYARAATRRVRPNRLSAMGRMQTSKEGVQARRLRQLPDESPALHSVLSIIRTSSAAAASGMTSPACISTPLAVRPDFGQRNQLSATINENINH